MKKIIPLLFLLAVLVTVPISAEEKSETNGTIKVGFDISGEHKVSREGLSGSENVKTGFSLSGEYVTAVGENLGIGLGINFQMPRSQENMSGEFNFISIYGLLKTYLVSSEVSPYFIGQLGYNSFAGDSEYKGQGSLKGGIYYGIGGGLIFQHGFQIEALYSVNKGSYELSGYNYYLGYYHLDFDVEYSKIVLSVGYNF